MKINNRRRERVRYYKDVEKLSFSKIAKKLRISVQLVNYYYNQKLKSDNILDKD